MRTPRVQFDYSGGDGNEKIYQSLGAFHYDEGPELNLFIPCVRSAKSVKETDTHRPCAHAAINISRNP